MSVKYYKVETETEIFAVDRMVCGVIEWTQKIQTTKTLIQIKFKHTKKLPKKAEKVCPEKRITPPTRLLKRYQGGCDTYICHVIGLTKVVLRHKYTSPTVNVLMNIRRGSNTYKTSA